MLFARCACLLSPTSLPSLLWLGASLSFSFAALCRLSVFSCFGSKQEPKRKLPRITNRAWRGRPSVAVPFSADSVTNLSIVFLLRALLRAGVAQVRRGAFCPRGRLFGALGPHSRRSHPCEYKSLALESGLLFASQPVLPPSCFDLIPTVRNLDAAKVERSDGHLDDLREAGVCSLSMRRPAF